MLESYKQFKCQLCGESLYTLEGVVLVKPFELSRTKASVCVCVCVWEEHSLRSLMALSLVVDRWQCCLSVKLQSFSQSLPDLLCV